MATLRSGLAITAGLIEFASTALAQSATQPPRYGRIQGVVFDSVSNRALGGASVQLVSAIDPSRARTATADDAGRFRYDSVAVGSWMLAARHPRLDSLAVQEIVSPVEVGPRGTARVTVAVPSARVLSERVCGPNANPADTSGYLFGTVRRAREDRAAVQGTVRVQWLELLLQGRQWVRQVVSTDATTAADGHFLACGVPASGIVIVRAWSGADSSGVVELTLPTAGITRRDLYVGVSRPLRVAEAPVRLDTAALDDSTSADSLITTRWRGDGQLRGRVRGGNGAPVVNARVAMRASGVEVRTDSAGAFTLNGLPTGTWTLDVRALGFEPQLVPVDVFTRDSAVLQYTMERAMVLDTVQIRATRRRLLGTVMADFEDRRKAGFGRFFGPEDLDKIQPYRFSDIMWRTMGVRSQSAGNSGFIYTMRGFLGRCAPTVFVDRMRMPNDGTLDSFLPAEWIRAVEVYQAGFGPPEFMDMLSGCGSIVVWTGDRPKTSGMLER